MRSDLTRRRFIGILTQRDSMSPVSVCRGDQALARITHRDLKKMQRERIDKVVVPIPEAQDAPHVGEGRHSKDGFVHSSGKENLAILIES